MFRYIPVWAKSLFPELIALALPPVLTRSLVCSVWDRATGFAAGIGSNKNEAFDTHYKKGSNIEQKTLYTIPVSSSPIWRTPCETGIPASNQRFRPEIHFGRPKKSQALDHRKWTASGPQRHKHTSQISRKGTRSRVVSFRHCNNNKTSPLSCFTLQLAHFVGLVASTRAAALFLLPLEQIRARRASAAEHLRGPAPDLASPLRNLTGISHRGAVIDSDRQLRTQSKMPTHVRGRRESRSPSSS